MTQKIAHPQYDITGYHIGQVAYRLTPPRGPHEFVMVSAVDNLYAHEVLVFSTDQQGEITDWCEIMGLRDTTSHEEVLGVMGYTIAEED